MSRALTNVTCFTGTNDSTCPTREIWLHRARPVPPNHSEAVHYQTADETMFVIGGSLFVGRKETTARGAVEIDANTAYKVVSASKAAHFVQFRPTDNLYVRVTRDGSKPTLEKNSEMFARLLRLRIACSPCLGPREARAGLLHVRSPMI